jgi:NTE family protein
MTTTDPHRPVRSIVLSGGGARGAYEAGVLRFLVEALPARTGIEPKFDIVSGTSVGAIHACFLAATAHMGPERGDLLSRIWEGLRVDEVFRFSASDLIGFPRKLLGVRRVAQQLRAGRRPDRLFGLLDTVPLEKLVVEHVPWKSIHTNIAEKRLQAVCVAATQIATGRAVVFVEQLAKNLPPWANQEHLRMQPIRLMPIHALASAAIPLLFPAVRVGPRYYADGGLRLNTPLAPAVRLGSNRIMIIGLRTPSPLTVPESLAQQRTEGFGNPMFLFGKVLNALLLSPIDVDIARMNFINEIIDSGSEAFGSEFLAKLNAVRDRPLQKLHGLVVRPSEDLGRLAGEVVGGQHGDLELSPFLRLFMRAFGTGAEPQESDLLSYLLFDSHYTKPLIELGYRDAEAQQDELARFFSDEPME